MKTISAAVAALAGATSNPIACRTCGTMALSPWMMTADHDEPDMKGKTVVQAKKTQLRRMASTPRLAL